MYASGFSFIWPQVAPLAATRSPPIASKINCWLPFFVASAACGEIVNCLDFVCAARRVSLSLYLPPTLFISLSFLLHYFCKLFYSFWWFCSGIHSHNRTHSHTLWHRVLMICSAASHHKHKRNTKRGSIKWLDLSSTDHSHQIHLRKSRNCKIKQNLSSINCRQECSVHIRFSVLRFKDVNIKSLRLDTYLS